ncbi:hypothetical protein [Romboutsia sp. 1001713B170207_170306_H8]|uniref:hypothetical protein n=1 Tax=Romboutsia sp. 1001713B170207_170306_H8 TaxID=2787112 RepID=UPI001896F0CA|nr:hypothetical protein [Romboutsia sp. 1001713B170207_170306_H8]
MLMLKSRHEEVVKLEKVASFEEGYQTGYDLAKFDKDKEIKSLINTIKTKEKLIEDIQIENEINSKKVEILRFFLACNYRKDVARYEAIAKKTKKYRIRKKAEAKIIKLKELQIAFE